MTQINTIVGMIGQTPIVELVSFKPKPGINIYAKLEGQNPSGSIKDRIVLGMIESAEAEGKLTSGDTIVEASSGNTAISLAMIAKHKGYHVKVVIPGEVVPSIEDVLGLYDAQVVWCGSRAGMKEAIETASTISNNQGSHYLQQFMDPTNPLTHYKTTGREILDAIPDIDVFVAGIGTGGTIMGVGRRLREMNPNIRVIGVEPQLGDKLQGLRSMSEGYIPPILDFGSLDGRFLVDSRTASLMARMVVRNEGIMVGISSGATLHVALRIAQRMDKGNIVVMFSDSGWKYLPAKPWNLGTDPRQEHDDIHWW